MRKILDKKNFEQLIYTNKRSNNRNSSIQEKISLIKEEFSDINKKLLDSWEKLEFAKMALGEEKYKAIWIKWIIQEDMTTEKIQYIAEDVPIEFINAIWWEFLSCKWMTKGKLGVIAFSMEIEQIYAIWVENLASDKIDYIKLQAIVFNLSAEEIKDFWFKKLCEMTLSEITVGNKKYEALWEVWKNNENNIKTDIINNIKRYLTPEQIIAIWTENLIKKTMIAPKIRFIWNNYTPDEIRIIWGYKLGEISYAELILPEDKYTLLLFLIRQLELKNPVIIDYINNNLSIEEIEEIWLIIDLMDLKDFRNYKAKK